MCVYYCGMCIFCSALSANELLRVGDLTNVQVLPGDPLFDLVLLNYSFVCIMSLWDPTSNYHSSICRPPIGRLCSLLLCYVSF